MTLRFPGGGCEPPSPISLAPDPPEPAPRQPLLTLRSAFIFATGVAAGVGAGILAYLAFRRPAEAVLAGATAAAATITFLHTHIG